MSFVASNVRGIDGDSHNGAEERRMGLPEGRRRGRGSDDVGLSPLDSDGSKSQSY